MFFNRKKIDTVNLVIFAHQSMGDQTKHCANIASAKDPKELFTVIWFLRFNLMKRKLKQLVSRQKFNSWVEVFKFLRAL